MITGDIATEEVRKLINVPSVKALVSAISDGEISSTEYKNLSDAKKTFIAIRDLPTSFDQVQQCVVNVNLYAPNLLSDVADRKTLRNIFLAVKPLIEDAYTSVISTKLETMTLFSEPTIKYSFYNLRVRVISVNESLNY